jgi:hypothetical protein
VRGCRRGLGGLVILIWGCTGPNPAFSPAPILDGGTGSGGVGVQPVREAGAETATGGSGGGQASDGPVGDIALEVAAGEVKDAPVDVVSPLDAADLTADLAPDRAPDLPADLSPDLPDAPVPIGTGLRGQYFDGSQLEMGDTGVLEMTRDNEVIDFDWGTGSPGGQVDDDWFSVRWTGKVMPRFSETYTFRTVADEGIRLWVNGQLIIDRWSAPNASVTNNGTITLQAYTQYEIKVEYFEQTGAAVARLSWMSSSQPLQIIPRANLFMPTP